MPLQRFAAIQCQDGAPPPLIDRRTGRLEQHGKASVRSLPRAFLLLQLTESVISAGSEVLIPLALDLCLGTQSIRATP